MIWRSKFFQRTYAHMAAVAIISLLTVSMSFAQGHDPDMVIRDCPNDQGGEPEFDCSDLWASQDIWIRNNNDNGTLHQNPIYGQRNWINVRLTNIRSRLFHKGTLHVYFAKASAGLGWPVSWYNHSINGVLYGDEIGTEDINDVLGGTSTIVRIPWDNVPNPQDFNDADARHFCLLARLVSQEDPMTFPEGYDLGTNVRYNNNIAWKNISVMDRANPRGAVDIENNTDRDMPITLRFTVADEKSAKLLEDAGITIRVELPPKVLEQWKAAGEPGEGVKAEGEGLVINAHNAWIGGIWLGPDDRQTLHVAIGYPDHNLDGEELAAQWDITQHDDATGEIVGGERYDITLSDKQEGEGKIMILPPKHDELSGRFSLSTYPNPISSMATIKYVLPADTRVTLTIFDASGRMVQEVVSNADNTAGSYEAVWDGTAADGTKMPSGTYICRLSTPLGSSEQQIKITR